MELIPRTRMVPNTRLVQTACLLRASLRSALAARTAAAQAHVRFPSMFAEPAQDWQLTPPDGGAPRKLGIRIGLPERIGDQWSVLVTCTEKKTWETVERRVQVAAWPQVLERAAIAVPELLQEHADKLGGGILGEVDRARGPLAR